MSLARPISALLITLSWPVIVGAREIGVFPGQSSTLTVSPGQVVSLGYRVHSSSSEPLTIEATLELPDGWSLLTPLQPCRVSQASSCLLMAHLRVPETAHATAHQARLVLNDLSRQISPVTTVTLLRVLAERRLELTLVSAPQRLIAGRTAELELLARNRSNVTLTPRVRAEAQPIGAARASVDQLSLEPGQAVPVRVSLTTEAALRQRATTIVSVRLSAEQRTVAEESIAIELIPRVGHGEPASVTVPARLSLGLTGGSGRGRPEMHVGLVGGGALDRAGAHVVRFKLHGPGNSQRISSLGRQAELFLAYQGPRASVGLGDQIFSLSPLIELGRWGRGLQANLDLEPWRIGGFFMRDRYGPLEERALYAGLGTRQTPRGLQLSLVEKHDQGRRRLANLHGWLSSQSFSTELEYGRSLDSGRHAEGLRASLSGRVGPLRFQAEHTRTDPGFGGQTENRRFQWARADVRLSPQTDAWLTYREDQSFINGSDPGRSAPEETVLRAGLTRQLARSRLALDLEHRRFSDRSPRREFDDRRQIASLGASLSRRISGLDLLASLGWGSFEDRRSGRSSTSLRGSVHAAWQHGPATSITMGAGYEQNLYELGEDQLSLSLGASHRLGRQLTGRCSLQHHHERGSSQTFTSCGLLWSLPSNRAISLEARHVTGDARPSYRLEYSLPLQLPLASRRDVARLTGEVINSSTGHPVADIVVSVAGLMAVTDANGRFTFTGLAVGTHELDLELGARSVDLIQLSTPRLIEVKAREPNHVTATVGPGARLSGTITRWSADHAQLVPSAPDTPTTGILEPTQLQLAGPVAQVLVILDNGTTTHRRLTDHHGRFTVTGLLPGTWHLGVDPASLPAGTIPERPETTVELGPGDETVLELRLVPQQRGLRLQHGGRALAVEQRLSTRP